MTVLSSALGQDCPIFQASARDLGSTGVPSTDGILGDNRRIPIAIQEINIVCLSQGETRDMYRFASVVAQLNVLSNELSELTTQAELAFDFP